jgi:hypothetical protein
LLTRGDLDHLCAPLGIARRLHLESGMLKLLGSYALARLLGGGLVLAIVIYLVLSLLT